MKELKNCKNLGKTIIENLRKVGIDSYSDMEKAGAVKIYKDLKKKFPEKTWPVCYYLYSIEGALRNKHWDDIGKRRKEELLDGVGLHT